MSYTVLARKYRSKDFDEVIGQDHIARTLKRAIESGRIAHAFLFTGTRGTGKTSTARILAKALNCEKYPQPTTKPCGECESCRAIARGDDIDVIEIDAASNTGVDNVRDIIENSAYRPARSRFKVYIIDEVHMLSKAAFNALLKTLEEPPDHVKFILATTEVEKVLQTILSRCQRYDFRNIPTREIAAHLKEIVKKEGIEAQDDALLLVAKAGAGSMRDSLSLLDRLLSVGEKMVTVEMIEHLLGLPKAQLMFDLAQAIGTGDVKGALEQTSAMITRGLSADAMVASLVDHLRNLLILRTCGPDSELVEVPGMALKELTAQSERFDPISLTQNITILEELRRYMRQSQSGRALLDATLVRLTLAEQFTPVAELLSRIGASDGDASQKKKPAEINHPAPANVPSIAPNVAAGFAPTHFETTSSPESATHPVEQTRRDIASTFAPPPAPPDASSLAPPISRSPAPTVDHATSNPDAAPIVAPPPALSFDEEDDDLPRPGKVWDDSGVDLATMLKNRNAGTSPEESQPAFTNIEPVAIPQSIDVTAAWGQVLESLKDQAGLYGILTHARLAEIRDEQAVVRIASTFSGMVKMLETPIKRDALSNSLTNVLGRRIGVKFEIDAAAPPEPAPLANRNAPTSPATPPSHAAPPNPASQRRPPERPAPAPMPEGPPAIKITPELLETMRQDPLIAAVMDRLGGQPVKIE